MGHEDLYAQDLAGKHHSTVSKTVAKHKAKIQTPHSPIDLVGYRTALSDAHVLSSDASAC